MRRTLAFLALLPACTTVRNVPHRPIQPGDRATATVRSETSATTHTMSVEAELTPSGAVRWATSNDEVLAADRIVDIERRNQVSSDPWLGAVEGGGIGLLAGAAAGAAMGYAAGDDTPTCRDDDGNPQICTWGQGPFSTAGSKAMVFGVLLGSMGLAIGGVFGAAIGHTTVEVSRGRNVPRVSVTPSTDGAVAGASWSF